MNTLAIIFIIITSVTFGVIALLGYLVTRMLGSDGWDKSNMTNALRLLAHVAMHPEDFVHMYYTKRSDGYASPLVVTRRAFPYLGQDELSEVVKTRPTAEEKR